MSYKYSDRNQIPLFVDSLDSSIDQDDPVRAYDSFIDAISLEELGIKLDLNKVGNSQYHPATMLKLLVYAYSYGWRSSRKIERAIHHNLSFIWLMGGLKPDHKTISEFRRKNKNALKMLLKKCARLCIKLDLIEGNTLFVDGTKIRANASINKSYARIKYKNMLFEVDERIDEILAECETIDNSEISQKSLVKMNKELTNKEQLKSTIIDILEEFENEGDQTKNGKDRKKNLTDPDCKNMRSIQGTHASYNIQSVVDDKNGLIVNVDATSETSDINQFSQQINKAEEVTEKQCTTACADAGYSNVDNLKKVDDRGTKVVVPSQRQALHKKEQPFNKSEFEYDQQSDCYYCPVGKKLRYEGATDKGNKLLYRIEKTEHCLDCIHFGICTESKSGRSISRLKNENLKIKLEQQYKQKESQSIYKQRKCKVEHPFGHIKRNLGFTSFLLRGKDGVQSEISIASTCFNIIRMITIFGGVQNFIQQMNKQVLNT